jgi:hypothetical protein
MSMRKNKNSRPRLISVILLLTCHSAIAAANAGTPKKGLLGKKTKMFTS